MNFLQFLIILISIKLRQKKGRKIEWLEFTFDAEKRIHSKRQPEMTVSGKTKHMINRLYLSHDDTNDVHLQLNQSLSLSVSLEVYLNEFGVFHSDLFNIFL